MLSEVKEAKLVIYIYFSLFFNCYSDSFTLISLFFHLTTLFCLLYFSFTINYSVALALKSATHIQFVCCSTNNIYIYLFTFKAPEFILCVLIHLLYSHWIETAARPGCNMCPGDVGGGENSSRFLYSKALWVNYIQQHYQS